MHFVLQPWQRCVVIFAAWVNRQQQEVIEYLMTENKVLKEKFGKRRILLNDDQRRRLAVKGKILGRKRLQTDAQLEHCARKNVRADCTVTLDTPNKRYG